MSPLLFNIVLEYVLRKIEIVGSGIETSAGRRLRDLAHVDGICLLAKYISDMRQMTQTVGVRVNTSKIEIIKSRF